MNSQIGKLFRSRSLVQRWRWGAAITLVGVSFIFGAVHYHPGISWQAIMLISFGGLVYAWVFQKTRTIHYAILTHFLTNALHVLLLQYPLV